MEFMVKTYEELSKDELYEILALRAKVFVEEQKIICQDPDFIDQKAFHAFLKEENKIIAYLRIINPEIVHLEPTIGRVIAVKRRSGIGGILLDKALAFIKSNIKTNSVRVEAQSYIKEFYAKHGFKEVSDEFLDCGVPHVMMIYTF